MSSVQKSSEFLAKYHEWDRLARQLLVTDWERKPRSMSEALEWLDGIPAPACLARRPTRNEVELARWVRTQNRKFDFRFSDAMRRYGPRFDFCAFVGGSVHAIALAQKTGYPAIYLCDETDVGDGYLAYLTDYVWVSLFC